MKCSECGQNLDAWDWSTKDGLPLCLNCVKKRIKKVPCSECGALTDDWPPQLNLSRQLVCSPCYWKGIQEAQPRSRTRLLRPGADAAD